MIKSFAVWGVCLCLCLPGCSVERAPTHETSLSVASAQQLVDNLNSRYQSTVAHCAGDTPAYYCSGIILRTTTYNAAYAFWTHSAPAAQLGSLTFSYIRRDIGTTGSELASGFIFSDQETALAENKAPTVRCIYPFMAGTQSSGRPGFGCGFATASAAQDSDLSTCATLGTPAVTAPLWLANFRAYGSNVRNQCSLSTLAADQFKASLEAHNGVDATHTASRNELLIATWREETPEQLPIEAFFYNATTGAGLFNAQSLRHSYYLKTSQRIPIVRVDFSAGDKNIFTWNAADQVDGWDVADQLNARYNNTANDCNGQAAYYCDGVFVRIATFGTAFHSWNPNPNNNLAVSFSYLRKDLKMLNLATLGQNAQGYVFNDAASYGHQGIYPLTVLCAFPYDGTTDERAGVGCGASSYYPNDSGPCVDLGITTLDAWRTHFNMYPPDSSARRYRHQCVLGADQAGFALSLMARENPQAEQLWWAQNEIMISRWPQNIPEQLPIEAFMYVYDPGVANGLPGAQFIQRDFYNQIHKVVPVISVALKTGGNNVFSYHPSDQGL